MSTYSKKILLFISICFNVFFASYLIYNKEEIKYVEKYYPVKEYVLIPKYMDEWDMFTMALMKVESDYDSTAVSSVGAKGYFQITPIYVKEVNRIHKTNFTMNDVTNLELSYEIFDLMQQAHNHDYDLYKAIIIHNGDHDWYTRRVMKEFEKIKKYEDIRNRVINLRKK